MKRACLLINKYVVLDCYRHDPVIFYEARIGTFLLLNALVWNYFTAVGSKIVEGSFGMKVTRRKTNILFHEVYYLYGTSRYHRYVLPYKHRFRSQRPFTTLKDTAAQADPSQQVRHSPVARV